MFHKPIAIVKCTIANLRNGAVKNPMFPSVLGKRYLGVGSYSTLNKRAYSLWKSMLGRAYSKDVHLKSPTYKDVEVCREWWNFQNFAKWCYSNRFINSKDEKGKRYHLDKDILVKGSKIYSPETCSFIPKDINLLFNKPLSEYPTGVSKVGKDFGAFVSCYGVQRYLGTYDSIEKAFDSYRKAKKSYMLEVAEKWVDKLDDRVYDALINYEIEISD